MASEFDIAQAAAAVYAESLLDLANEAELAQDIAVELDELKALWHAEPAFAIMMSSAAIDDGARAGSIRSAFGAGRVRPLVLNLMLVLNDKRRSMIFPLVCDAYRRQLDEQLGREEVQVTSAAPLDDGHRRAIRSHVERLTGQEAILKETVDPQVLGGVKVLIRDRLFDVTLRRRLKEMRADLLAAMEEHLRDNVARFVTEG